MELKRTPLYGTHKSLGARIVPFAGWEMPVQYSGVIDEHLAVRNACGLFDVSHMGEILITGPGAIKAVQRLGTNDIEKAVEGQCQYTPLCYADGGVVDDCIVYRFGPERFLVCVNASNTDKAFEWMRSEAGKIAAIRNVSADYAEIAIQGPFSAEILKKIIDKDPRPVKRYHFIEAKVAGCPAIVSRTGYTGEDGFEVYSAPDSAVKVWDALMDAGKDSGIKPAGLGARDTLRLEMGYPLYGHELSEKITPIEAGLGRFVALDKADFIGKEALKKQVEKGAGKAIIGFEMLEAGVPRQGYDVTALGVKLGEVTSGTHSPSLGRGVGMAYADASLISPGINIEIMVRGRAVKAKTVKTPFYSRQRVKTPA